MLAVSQSSRLRRLGRLFVVSLTASILTGAGLVSAQEVPIPLRAAVLLRALAYEKGFANDATPAKIVVAGTGKATAEIAGVTAALTQLAKGGNREIAVVKHEREAVDDTLRSLGADVIYVATGSNAVLAAARRSDSLVVCGDPHDVGKGCVLSVESAGKSSRLVIDLTEADRKGLRFDARILRLSRVIR